MSSADPGRIVIPEEALREFEDVESMDWGEGIPLDRLIGWINVIEEIYRPANLDERVNKPFTERSFRHYQTLGAIDQPARIGKRAMYGFRQYLQGLVIRKLLWERVNTDHIVKLMKGKSNQEYKHLLFQGIEIVASEGPQLAETAYSPAPETWVRHQLAGGIELHRCQEQAGLSREEIDAVLKQIDDILSEARQIEK